jgi:tetratricopeptide (TPR) repeat protein
LILVAAPVASAAARADQCPSQAGALPAPPIPETEPLQQALQRLGTSRSTATRRLELLDQLAGLDHDIDELPNYRPEAALGDGIALRRSSAGRVTRTTRRRSIGSAACSGREAALRRRRPRFSGASPPRERAEGKASLDYAYCEHWLGVLYNEQGRYAEAERVLRDAAEIRRRLLGPTHPSYAYVLFTLGAVYMSLGDYPRAEEINRQVLAIREQAFGACGLVVATRTTTSVSSTGRPVAMSRPSPRSLEPSRSAPPGSGRRTRWSRRR